MLSVSASYLPDAAFEEQQYVTVTVQRKEADVACGWQTDVMRLRDERGQRRHHICQTVEDDGIVGHRASMAIKCEGNDAYGTLGTEADADADADARRRTVRVPSCGWREDRSRSHQSQLSIFAATSQLLPPDVFRPCAPSRASRHYPGHITPSMAPQSGRRDADPARRHRMRARYDTTFARVRGPLSWPDRKSVV